jgi:hypothetical protein
MGTSEPRLSQRQPCVVISAPEENELSAIVPNTHESITPCARFFSSGR